MNTSTEPGAAGQTGLDETPVGDWPGGSRWPIVLSVLVWASWVVFLVAMVLMRSRPVAPA